MKNQKSHLSAVAVSLVTGVTTFVLLSIFAGGLMEFSRDAGFWVWLRDLLAYNFTNKVFQKLAASVALGGGAYFVCQMAAYGKAVSAKKRARATRVRFDTQDQDNIGRTA